MNKISGLNNSIHPKTNFTDLTTLNSLSESRWNFLNKCFSQSVPSLIYGSLFKTQIDLLAKLSQVSCPIPRENGGLRWVGSSSTFIHCFHSSSSLLNTYYNRPILKLLQVETLVQVLPHVKDTFMELTFLRIFFSYLDMLVWWYKWWFTRIKE